MLNFHHMNYINHFLFLSAANYEVKYKAHTAVSVFACCENVLLVLQRVLTQLAETQRRKSFKQKTEFSIAPLLRNIHFLLNHLCYKYFQLITVNHIKNRLMNILS